MRTITFTGQLTQDVAPKFIKEGDYLSARNLYFHTSKDGKSGLVRKYQGFKKIDATSYGKVVGSVTDAANSKVYYFVKGTDSVWVYDLSTDTTELLIEYDFKFGDFVDAAILNEFVFFTDGINQPRVIETNLDYTTVTDQDITLIKPAPLFPLVVSKESESSTYSPLARKAFIFSYRYVYKNNQPSVLAPYTENIYCDNTTKGITITPNPKESIPTYVDRIEILARENGTDFWRIISVEQVDFESLLFSGIKGRQITLTESQKLFENIPVKSKCVEVAKDRVFLANNTEGYDTYDIPSLEAKDETEILGPEPTYYPVWVATRRQQSVDGADIVLIETDNYYLRKDNGSVFYFLATGDVRTFVNGIPTGVVPGDYTGSETELVGNPDVWTGVWEITFNNIIGPNEFDESNVQIVDDPEIHYVLFTPEVDFAVGETKFKNKSQYQIGIAFYDRYLRSGGVYTNQKCLVTIDDNFRGDEIKKIDWSLNNDDRLEIPLWAESYQIVRSDNLTRSTFIQGRTSDIYWVYRESNEDKFTREYRTDAIAIEIDISGSFRAGTSYNFTEGDLIDIGDETFRIESGVGSKLRVQPRPVLSFERSSSPWPVREYYEIWTPKQESVSEIVNGEEISSNLFYEISEVYRVLEPHTENRTFEKTSGFLVGDVTVIDAETYDYADSRNVSAGAFDSSTLVPTPNNIVIEAQNPENILDLGWIKSLGRPSVILGIGQVQKKNFIRYSNRIIQGTRINGTSRFDFGDEDQVPLENGEINVLSLTSKQQADGNIMLAVCEQDVSSIYLGEVQFIDNEGSEVVSKSAQVIGTINTLKGGYGTRHPNSFVRYKGRAWWWDEISREVVRYDSNGVRPISQLGNRSYFYNRVGGPVACFDPFHQIYFIGFSADSFGFHESTNQWRSFYDFVPESATIVDEFMITFKDGIAYRSNDDGYEYYDGIYQGEIQFYLPAPSPMILENIGIYASENIFEWSNGNQIMKPDIEIQVSNDEGQQTDLLSTDFDVFESVAFAHFFRDTNSTGGILNGDVMRSDIHKFTIKIRNFAEIEYININEQQSIGVQ